MRSKIKHFLAKAKYRYDLAAGNALLLMHEVAYAQEVDDSAFKSIGQWVIKTAGWISLVLLVLTILMYLGTDSQNSKNILMLILGVVFVLFATVWLVNLYNQKLDEINGSIFG